MLVHQEKFITAVLSIENILTMYRSPIVKDDSDMFLPVREILDRSEHRIVSSEVLSDPDMMFGSGYLTVYKIGELKK